MLKWWITKTTYGNQNPTLVDTYSTNRVSEALEYCRMLASEHYGLIYGEEIPVIRLPDGAEFVTSNGTPVEYRIRHNWFEKDDPYDIIIHSNGTCSLCCHCGYRLSAETPTYVDSVISEHYLAYHEIRFEGMLVG